MKEPAEGVAAPLEPSALDYAKKVDAMMQGEDGLPPSKARIEYLVGEFEAYAAAVSKNLQEELTRAKQYGKTEYGIELLLRKDLDEAWDRIRELEKEIAALRETK